MRSFLNLVNRKKRFFIAGAAVIILAIAGFFFFGNRASAEQYMTAKVDRGNLRNTVTATGTLQAVTTVQVGSQASGTISALYADFNSKVRKGQIIAQLDPATLKAQVDQSRANLVNAEAGLKQAKATAAASRAGVTDARAKDLAARSTAQNQQAGASAAEANLAVAKAERDDAASFLRQQQSLLSAGVIAQRDFDVAQTAYQTADARYNQALAQLNQAKLTAQSAGSNGIVQSQATIDQSRAQAQQSDAGILQAAAQVQQAQAALQLAELNLSHTTIASPIDGVVVSRDVSVGQTVAASLSAPTLFTIANDLTQMQVIANIDQADIGLVEQAKGVKFAVDAFPEQEFTGTIEQMRLNPVTVQNVVTYNVVIDVSNPEEKLKPGMTANLTITIDERNNVLRVPNAALRFTPQSTSGGGGRSGGGGNGNRGGGGRRNGNQPADSGANANGDTANVGNEDRVTAPTEAVLPGQTRVVWVLGSDNKPQRRRIKIGLSDGAFTEVTDGELKEGEMVITGVTGASTSRPAAATQTAPGFGGAPRTGGGGGGGGRGR
jgi:HlyD family secretion protein